MENTFVSKIAGNSSVPKRKKWLSRFYDQVSRYEFTDPDHAYQLFEEIIGDLGSYTASPDEWHNTGMVAARVRHREAELALFLNGLEQWPDDIDLLCDVFQLRYSTHYDLKAAQELWEKLDAFPKEKTGPYWRFWVYSAIYFSTRLNNRVKALELLDQGLRFVRRDGLQDILRNYRRVLVDSAPGEPLNDEAAVKRYERNSLDLLEQRYKLGIELGVENSYVLATELAQLYQERAGANINRQKSGESSLKNTRKDPEPDYLEKALECLELAERLYTGNPNHPIHEIYETRARILMSLRRYSEALTLLRSLPESRTRDTSDLSLQSMLQLAARSTGQPLGEEKETDTIPPEKALDIAIPILFSDGGRPLVTLARNNPTLKNVLLHVVAQLQEE